MVSDSDLTDLEYQLSWQNSPDSTLTGQVRDVNLDMLTSPPEGGNLRPPGRDDRYETDPDKQWLPCLTTCKGCGKS
jgi:hypothetical protein